MPKNIDGVSLPERRKSIRNIPIPEGRRKTDPLVRPAPAGRRATDGVALRVSPAARPMETAEETLEPVAPRRPVEGGARGGKRLWLIAAGAIIILLFAVLSLFKGATLSYTPRSEKLTFLGETYSAYKSSGTGLVYSVVKLSGDKGLSVPASGESDVSRKASGTIIVYNDASADSQKLVENTRFESTDGKVYRIAQGITVPGKTSAGPGSVEAVVFADAPGQSYNIGLSDFTLPGLKGTNRFETIYARSKTAMTGGFIGKEKVVNAQDLAKAKSSLQADLRAELIAKASAEVPDDFVLFPALSTLTYEDLPQTAGGNGDATVNLRGNLYGIMFKRSDLANALALGKVEVAAGESVDIPQLESLQVAFAGTAPADVLNVNKIDFTVTGGAELVWRTDEVALKSDLAGRAKSDLTQILANYPTVESASATISPFWKSSFPDKPADITVKKLNTE